MKVKYKSRFLILHAAAAATQLFKTDGRDGKATVQHGQAVGYLEVGEGWGREGGQALEWVTLVVV